MQLPLARHGADGAVGAREGFGPGVPAVGKLVPRPNLLNQPHAQGSSMQLVLVARNAAVECKSSRHSCWMPPRSGDRCGLKLHWIGGPDSVGKEEEQWGKGMLAPGAAEAAVELDAAGAEAFDILLQLLPPWQDLLQVLGLCSAEVSVQDVGVAAAELVMVV